VPKLSGEQTYFFSCACAQLSGLAWEADSGVPVGEGNAAADRAMDLLRRAVAMGYADLEDYRNESNLDPIRGRADFEVLMMDLAFSVDPFAR
jgi:hypothetical protein